MPTKANALIEKIGEKLREEWSDLVNSPLPERLVVLLAQLEGETKPAPPSKDRQHNPRLI